MSGAASQDPLTALRALPMGALVEVTEPSGRRWSGAIIPPNELSGSDVLYLKLESGYNVGLRIGAGTRFSVVERRGERPAPEPSPSARPAPSGPWIALLTTGGTIASRVDYETGGVRPVKDEREILEFFPELDRSGHVRVLPVFDRLSEDLVPADWLTLAERTVAAFADGARGVVIAHGTDTLGFSAAALSFLVRDLPGPVVLVGAQRSPDRPSSDGPGNLSAAIRVAAEAPLGEVVALMHAGLSDERYAIHRGTWVRKMHASRRDAFESRTGPPIGSIDGGGVTLTARARPPARGPVRLDGTVGDGAGLLWFYPGLAPARAEALVAGLRGLVLAGTGLGHVASAHLPWIRGAVARGTVVGMTSQCLGGRVDPFVYATGRELLRAGVTYLEDLIPETAYAKLVWALGRSSAPDEVRRLLTTDQVGEFLPRHESGGDA